MIEILLRAFNETNPIVFVVVAVSLLILYVLGYPALKARKDSVVQQEIARKKKAQTDGEAADIEAKDFRRNDSAADIWEARWKRAVNEADDERAGKKAALILVDAARADVHAAANSAQLMIAGVEQRARAEIERITNAAEARIFEAKENAEIRVAELTKEVNLQGQLIEALTRQNRQCEESNQRLQAEVNQLREWQVQTDLGKGL